LSERGVFAQWLPLFQMSVETLRVITRTFVDVFPHTSAYLAHFNVESPVLGLIGTQQAVAHTSQWYRDTKRDGVTWAGSLEQLALAREIDLFGCAVADDGLLRRWASGAPLNTDSHPILIFTAPRFPYDPTQTRQGLLQQLLDSWAPSKDILRGTLPSDDASFVDRVVGYAKARDFYLRGQLARYGARSPTEPLDLVLQSVEASSDFRTAYVLAVQIAAEVHRENPDASRAILEKLIGLVPGEPMAAHALRRLFP